MLFVNNTSTDVYFNLAVEEYLLKNYREDIFMLWQNNSAVVLGKYQDVQAEIDVGFADKKKIDIARRYSGGGAVYQDFGNINLTFIENTNSINFDKYVRQIIDFLTSIGIKAQADDRRGIYAGRLKVSGSAQSVYKSRVMYHCTLLYSADLDVLRQVLNGSPDQTGDISGSNNVRAVRSVKSEVTNICSLLQSPPDINGFRSLIFNFFFSQNPENRICNLSENDFTAVGRLREKYAAQEWILGRYAKTLINQLSI